MILSRHISVILGALLLALGLGACGDDLKAVASPNIGLSHDRVLFNTLQAGESEIFELFIENRGDGPLVIDSITISGDSDNVFSIVNGWGGQALEILPEGVHPLQIQHDSIGDLSPTGTLRFVHNDTQRGGQTSIPISIVASDARIFVNPNPINFGRVPAGTEAQLTATMTNIGGLPLIVTDYFIVGGAGVFSIPADFEFGAVADGESATLTLAPDASFEFPIHYAPTDDGFDNARLIVKSNDPATVDGDYTVEIQANGAEPCIEIAPHNDGTYDFGQRFVGQTAVEAFTLTNCSDIDFGETLIVSSLSIRDDSSPAYVLGDVQLPIELLPGGQYPFTVEFTPTVDQQFEEGWLVAVSNDAYTPELTIQLNGLGSNNECPTAVARCTVEHSGAPPESELFVLPLANLVCDASGSEDPDGTIGQYIWSVAEAPAGSTSEFIPDDTSETTFFVDLAGRYVLNLEVIDDRGCVSDPAPVTLVSRPDEDIHVQLVWSTPSDPDESDTGFGAGSDLDIHLLHPNGCWEDSSWDCHFRAREPNWGNSARSDDDPSLDIDDTDGAGPENINLDNPESGTSYTVGVHYYNDHGYGVSYATLRVYIFGELVFQAEDKEMYNDSWWVVASIDWPETTISPIDLDYSAVPPCGG